MNTLGDEALMLRFQDEGDMAAFEMLFRRHKDRFVSFLWRLAGSEAVAEDVSQETWLKLIEVARERKYRAVGGSSFRTWLYTLGRNRYIDRHVRSHAEGRRTSLDTEENFEDPDFRTDPLVVVSRAQQESLVAEALRTLPWAQRDVIALWASEFSLEQISALTGAPRDTVLSRKKYALARLHRALEQAGMAQT